MPRMHVLTENNELVPMVDSSFSNEDEFQALLARYPGLMPGELFDADNPRRWFLLTREAGIALAGGEGGSRFSMDHLFVDQDAIPTLVEVKRASDTRSRREVVAQMLDYAANLWAWGPGEAASCLEQRCIDEQLDVAAELEAFLGPETDHHRFWEQVDANIAAGRLRLVFVADRISRELRQIIEFLNSQLTRAEVVAVEVRQLKGEGITTLVSDVIGLTAAAVAAKAKGPRSGRHLTAEEFATALDERCSPDEATGVQTLMQWCEESGGWVSYGTGSAYPACYLNWRGPTGAIWPLIAMLPNYMQVPLEALEVRPPFDDPTRLAEFRSRLQNVPGVLLTTDRRPSFPFAVVADAEQRAEVMGVLSWFVEQLTAQPTNTASPA